MGRTNGVLSRSAETRYFFKLYSMQKCLKFNGCRPVIGSDVLNTVLWPEYGYLKLAFEVDILNSLLENI